MVLVHRDAEAEVEFARTYLEQQSLGLGGRFLEELNVSISRIAVRPESFPFLETLPPEEPYRRAMIKRFHYLVIFEILPNAIRIVAVAHASRAPNYWLGR